MDLLLIFIGLVAVTCWIECFIRGLRGAFGSQRHTVRL